MACGYHIEQGRLLGSTVLEHSYLLRVRYYFHSLFIKSSNSLDFCQNKYKNHVSKILSITAVGDEAKICFLWILLILLVKGNSINKFVRLYITVHLTPSNASRSLIICLLQEVKDCFHAACANKIMSRLNLPKKFYCVKISKVIYLPRYNS